MSLGTKAAVLPLTDMTGFFALNRIATAAFVAVREDFGVISPNK
jgi:hypothetical protein